MAGGQLDMRGRCMERLGGSAKKKKTQPPLPSAVVEEGAARKGKRRDLLLFLLGFSMGATEDVPIVFVMAVCLF